MVAQVMRTTTLEALDRCLILARHLHLVGGGARGAVGLCTLVLEARIPSSLTTVESVIQVAVAEVDAVNDALDLF